jgi:hypothetical protein
MHHMQAFSHASLSICQSSILRPNGSGRHECVTRTCQGFLLIAYVVLFVTTSRAPTVVTFFPLQPPRGDIFLCATSPCTVLQFERSTQEPPYENHSQPKRVTALASPHRPNAVRTSDGLEQSHHRLHHFPPSPPRRRSSECKPFIPSQPH